jgi:hypothetical protein
LIKNRSEVRKKGAIVSLEAAKSGQMRPRQDKWRAKFSGKRTKPDISGHRGGSAGLELAKCAFDFLLGLSSQAFFATQDSFESFHGGEKMDGLRFAKEHCIDSFSGCGMTFVVASRGPERSNALKRQSNAIPQSVHSSHLHQPALEIYNISADWMQQAAMRNFKNAQPTARRASRQTVG